MKHTVAVLLTLLLVLSVVTPALAGGGTANTVATVDGTTDKRSQPAVPFQSNGADLTVLESGSSYWAGTTLRFDGSEVVENVAEASASNRTFQIWQVDSWGNTESVLSSFTVQPNGSAKITTGALRKRVVIQYDGKPVYVSNGVGYTESPPDGTDVNVETSAFTINQQSLSASWHDSEIYEGQVTHLDLTSNREQYVVAVSVTMGGTPLSFQNLTRLFDPETYAADYDAQREENQLLLDATATTEYRVNASWLPDGSARFQFDVVDSTGFDETTLWIGTPDGTPRIRSIDRSPVVGDTFGVRVECDHCYFILGSGAADGPLDLLELTDENGDGVVELQINTRYAGLISSAIPGTNSAYSAGPDNVTKYDTDDKLEDRDRFRESAYIGLVRDAVGINYPGLTRVLEPGDLTIRLSTSDYLISREKYGENQPPPGRPLVVPDEADATTIFLEERTLTTIEAFTAPPAYGGTEELSTVREKSLRNGEVAIRDRLLFRIDLTGVYGYLSIESEDIQTILDNEAEGLDLSLTPQSAGQAVSSDSIAAATRFFVSPSEHWLYGIIDTKRLNQEATLTTGSTYSLQFQLTGGGPSVGEAEDGYPYLPSGATETVQSAVVFHERSVTVESPDPEDARIVDQSTVTIAGETTVAAGSKLSIRADAHDPYVWSRSTTVSVQEDGSWSGAIDFSEAPGTEFTVSVIDGSVKRTSFTLEHIDDAPTVTAGTQTSPRGDGTDSTPTADGHSGSATTPTDGSGDGSPANKTSSSNSNGQDDDTNQSSAEDTGLGLFTSFTEQLPAEVPLVEIGGVLIGLGVLLFIFRRIR